MKILSVILLLAALAMAFLAMIFGTLSLIHISEPTRH